MSIFDSNSLADKDYRKLLAKEFLLDYQILGEIYSEKIRWQFQMQNYHDRLGIRNWITRSISNVILTEPIRIVTNNENINNLIDNEFLGRMQFNANFAKMLPYFLGIGDGLLTVHRDADGLPSVNYIPGYNVLPIEWEGNHVSKLVWFNTMSISKIEYITCVIESVGMREIRLYEVGHNALMRIETGNPVWKKIFGADMPPIVDRYEESLIPKFAWVSTGIPNARWIQTPFSNSFIWPWWMINKIEWAWDLLQEELEASRKRIFVDKDLVKSSIDPYVKDPITGLTTRVKEFNWRSNVYEVVDLGTQEKIREYTPTIRLGDFKEFFKSMIQTYCQIIGLGADFYSLVKPGNPVTATQVMLEHREAYNTINVIKYNLTTAIQTIVAGLVDYWIEDGLLSESDRLNSIYEVGVEFDDGVFIDRGKEIEQGINMLNAGQISQFRFLTKHANLSKADALREIEATRQEAIERAELEMQIQIEQMMVAAQLGMGGEEGEEKDETQETKKK